jgi:hypothetical protein
MLIVHVIRVLGGCVRGEGAYQRNGLKEWKPLSTLGLSTRALKEK